MGSYRILFWDNFQICYRDIVLGTDRKRETVCAFFHGGFLRRGLRSLKLHFVVNIDLYFLFSFSSKAQKAGKGFSGNGSQSVILIGGSQNFRGILLWEGKGVLTSLSTLLASWSLADQNDQYILTLYIQKIGEDDEDFTLNHNPKPHPRSGPWRKYYLPNVCHIGGQVLS